MSEWTRLVILCLFLMMMKKLWSYHAIRQYRRSVMRRNNNNNRYGSNHDCTKEVKNLITDVTVAADQTATGAVVEGQKMYEIDYSRVRYVGRVTYFGGPYAGWQTQPGERTIQGTLHKIFTQRFNQSIYPVGASRTDAGVHARGQAFHFDVPAEYNMGCLQHFEDGVNRLLPPTIKVFNVSLAPPGNTEQRKIGEPFHATKSSIGKLYSYRFCVNRYVHPFDHARYAHIYHPIRPLHFPLFEQSLQMFIGTHDFTAFGNKIDKKYEEFAMKSVEFSTIRTIKSITLHQEDPMKQLYRVDFIIESALYKMIRNIMGTCFQVGFRKMTLEQLHSLLYEKKSRKENVSKGAVPEGLTLEHVFYDFY